MLRRPLLIVSALCFVGCVTLMTIYAHSNEEASSETVLWEGRGEASMKEDIENHNPWTSHEKYSWSGRLEAAQKKDMVDGNPIKSVYKHSWAGAGQKSVSDAIAGLPDVVGYKWKGSGEKSVQDAIAGLSSN